MADISVRLIGDDGGVPRMMLQVGDATEFAAKASKTLTDALQKQRREEGLTAAESRALASALRATGDAEAKAAAQAITADVAIRRLDDSMKKSASDQGGLHTALAKTGKLLGGLAGAGGIFAAGSGALALASPIGAATAALGAFGVVAIPTFTKVEKALTSTGSTAKKAWAALTPDEKALGRNLEAIKKSFSGLENAIAPVLVALTGTVRRILPALVPVFTQLAKSGGTLVTELFTPLAKFLSSNMFASLAKQLGQLAVQAGQILGPALAQLLKVFLRLFVQIGPSGIQLLRALAPAIVQITTALAPMIVLFAKLTAAVVTYLAKNHLLIPALAALGVALALTLDTNPVGAFLLAISSLVVGITYLAKHWDQVWNGIKSVTNTTWHWLYDNVFAKLITFFTKTIPTVLDIMKESVRILWDTVKTLFLKGVYDITGIMGHLPGPLGAPFRAAHKDIAGELAAIQADVAKAARNIQGDWNQLHGKTVHISVALSDVIAHVARVPRFAAGTSGAPPGWAVVGEKGPELVSMRGGETVIPNHAIRGYAGGTSGWEFSLGFQPGVNSFLRGFNNIFSGFENRVTGSFASATAGAFRQALERGLTTGALPPGGGVSGGAIASLARRMFPWPSYMWTDFALVENREAGWNMRATNPSSGAYGLAQFINGPSEYYQWGGNPNTAGGQLTAMFNYIRSRYGNPLRAWGHEMSYGWYDRGGYLKPGWTMAYNGTGRPEPVGGAGQLVIEVHGTGGEIDQMFLTWLRRAVRVRGGNVQTVLGRN